MLHYNFPPYSVGERPDGWSGSARNRPRQARLARHASAVAGQGRVPYTHAGRLRSHRVQRLVLDGDVCGSSMSMMDAGVPLKRPCAGIAMGLIKEGERFAVLSDILGDEDHLGRHGLQGRGYSEGITSLQMDIKITSITEEIMRIALGPGPRRPAAHPGRDGKGRYHRRTGEGVSDHAPRVTTMHGAARTRSATSLVPAARLSVKSAKLPAQKSTSKTMAPLRSLPLMPKPATRRSNGFIPSSQNRKLALSTKARSSRSWTSVLS